MQTLVNQLMAWQLHPVADHFTVAIVIIAVLIDLVASLMPSWTWIRQMAVTLIVLGAIAAAASNLTGGWEADRVEKLLSGPARDVFERHKRLGDILPWVIGVLALWRLGIQFIGFIAGSRALYLLVAIVAGGAILYQGHEGGELVYTYGVGTAVMPTEAATPAPTPVPAESATPAEATGIVYAASRDDWLYAVNASNGALLWRFKAGKAIESSPTVAGTGVGAGVASPSHTWPRTRDFSMPSLARQPLSPISTGVQNFLLSSVPNSGTWRCSRWPVFGSRRFRSSVNSQATWAVWQWKTGAYPTVMTLGWFSTWMFAVKLSTTVEIGRAHV
jgi:uncharacterized membrane protein